MEKQTAAEKRILLESEGRKGWIPVTDSQSRDAELDVFLDIGRAMLEAGAEIHRVEDTLARLCSAYGMEKAEIFAIRSLILVTIRNRDGKTITASRRIYQVGINMGQLEELNQLSRSACAEKPEPKALRNQLETCLTKRFVSNWEGKAGYMLAAAAFACFFGGRLRDGAAAAILGLLLWEMDQRLAKKRSQRFLYTVAASMALGFCARLWGLFDMGFRVDKIMIGTIMLLIPGMAFMNSVRDMINNNAINGLFSCLDAVTTAGAIAVGFAVPLLLLGI